MEILIILLLIAWLNGSMASKRNRNVPAWALAGLLLGFLSTIVLLIAGDKA